jgi:ectoine hydroxylase-related dioxygenase (phytanoyl-CoA dioxygenase family)
VALHQDLTIPVAGRVDSPQCQAWSCKEGTLHVQPPTSLLEELVAVRVHLTDCDESNGALYVVPGSHRFGRLDLSMARRLGDEHGKHPVPCLARDALLMRPLLLHSSSKAVSTSPRPVLHFLVGPALLPEGLQWPEAAEAQRARGAGQG